MARANAFIEPVPDEPGSYRYFPFFRDLLRARLAYEAPEAGAELHRGAARWFRRTGAVEQSVRHLVEVGGAQGAADQRPLVGQGEAQHERLAIGAVSVGELEQ